MVHDAQIQARPGLWRNTGFRNLWLSHSVSLVGTQVTVLALPLAAVLLLHASALQVSLLAATEFIPALVLGLPAGAWVERLPLRPVLIGSDLARLVAVACVPAAYLAGHLSLGLLYAAAFCIGLGTLLFDVAQLSYLPALVPEDDLADGNALLEGARSFAQFAGPTAGGFLVQFLAAPLALAVDAVSFALSAAFLGLIRTHPADQPDPEPRTKLRHEVAEGLRFVLGHPLLRPITLAAAAAELAFAAVLALQVVFASRTLGLSPAAIGIALALGNAGGLAGAVISGRLARRLGFGPALVLSVAGFTAGAALLPLARGAAGLAAGLFVVYLGVVVFNVLQTTVCQLVTPARLLGRMNATLRFVTWGMVPLGAVAGGLLAGPLGLRGVLWAAAAVCALSLLPPLLSPVRSLRTWDGDPDAATPELKPVVP